MIIELICFWSVFCNAKEILSSIIFFDLNLGPKVENNLEEIFLDKSRPIILKIQNNIMIKINSIKYLIHFLDLLINQFLEN